MHGKLTDRIGNNLPSAMEVQRRNYSVQMREGLLPQVKRIAQYPTDERNREFNERPTTLALLVTAQSIHSAMKTLIRDRRIVV